MSLRIPVSQSLRVILLFFLSNSLFSPILSPFLTFCIYWSYCRTQSSLTHTHFHSHSLSLSTRKEYQTWPVFLLEPPSITGIFFLHPLHSYTDISQLLVKSVPFFFSSISSFLSFRLFFILSILPSKTQFLWLEYYRIMYTERERDTSQENID